MVTDGELRRESFQSELVAATDGFEGVSLDALAVGRVALRRARRQDAWSARREMAVVRAASAPPQPGGRGVHVPARDHRPRRRRSRSRAPACSPTSGRRSARARRTRASTTSWPTWSTSSATRSRELRAARLPLRPARRAALPAADRPDVARLLRGARLDRRALALLRDRARQRGHRRRAGHHLRLPPVPRQPGQPLAGRRRLRRRSPRRSSAASTPSGCCSSTTTSARAASTRCASCPTTSWSCSGS